MDNELWVTTVDNPFDPFTQWDQWYRFDELNGYHTCSEIARLAPGSPLNQSDKEMVDEINTAIQILCERCYPVEVWVPCVKGKTRRW